MNFQVNVYWFHVIDYQSIKKTKQYSILVNIVSSRLDLLDGISKSCVPFSSKFSFPDVKNCCIVYKLNSNYKKVDLVKKQENLFIETILNI